MPQIFKRMWEGWKKIALVIGVFQTKLFLTIFYYILLLPFGALVRLFMDPLQARMGMSSSGWRPRETRDRGIDDLRRQS